MATIHVLKAWLTQDLRYAYRLLAKSPVFTFIVVLTLALGIGANTAVFSLVNTVFLRSLPYRQAEDLVVVWNQFTKNPSAPPMFSSYRDLQYFQENSRTLEQISAATWATGGQIMSGHGPARNVLAMPVSLGFFSLLGIAAQHGRTFQASDLGQGCSVVLKDSFWRSSLSGQRNIIGQKIRLNDRSCAVLGVMPADFTFYPNQIAMWQLITPESVLARDPEHGNVGIFARLRHGVSVDTARKELGILYRREHQGEQAAAERTPALFPLQQQFSFLTGPNLRLSLLVLFAGVNFVLLVACLNVASLLLDRFEQRRKELAIRAALGSGRIPIIRQLLSEGLLLSCGGMAGGLLLAKGILTWFRLANPVQLPPGNAVAIDSSVLIYTSIVVLMTMLLFGLIPALHASRFDVQEALTSQSRTASGGPHGHRLTNFLVILQIGCSTLLLLGASLVVQSLTRLTSVPLGFQTDHRYAIALRLPPWNYQDPEQRLNLIHSILASAKQAAHSNAVTLVDKAPLTQARFEAQRLEIASQPKPDITRVPPNVAPVTITPEYFETMGIAVQQGRSFNTNDRHGSQQVVIVNKALVRKFFPQTNPLGKQIRFATANEQKQDRPQEWWTIVGVVGNEKESSFFHEMSWSEFPCVYRPVAQDPPDSLTIIAHTSRPQSSFVPSTETAIRSLNPAIPLVDDGEMKQSLAHITAYPRFRALLLTVFAAIATLLSSLGLYGLLSQSVRERTLEIGIRMALGAQRRGVIWLIASRSLRLVAIGLIAGFALSSLGTRYLSSLLYGLTPSDPATFASIGAAFVAIAFVAASVPARRAATVDPSTVLRHE